MTKDDLVCAQCGGVLDRHRRHVEVTYNIFAPTPQDGQRPVVEHWCMPCRTAFSITQARIRKGREEYRALHDTAPRTPYRAQPTRD